MTKHISFHSRGDVMLPDWCLSISWSCHQFKALVYSVCVADDIPFHFIFSWKLKWRRWRCCVGSWTSARWLKTTCWSMPWLTLSAAYWPLWRTSTRLWPPGPDCCWIPSRGRPCRWPAIICLARICVFLHQILLAYKHWIICKVTRN